MRSHAMWLVVMACGGGCSAPAHAEPAPAESADQSSAFAARVAQRREAELQQLLAIDRQSLALAERTEQVARSLYDAGRVTHADLAEAQAELQGRRAQLAQREQELAELRSRQLR